MKIVLRFSGSENKFTRLFVSLLPLTVVLRLFFVFKTLPWRELRCIWCLHKTMNCVCSFLCKVLKDSMLTYEKAVLWFAGLPSVGLEQFQQGTLTMSWVSLPCADTGVFSTGWQYLWAAFRVMGVLFPFGKSYNQFFSPKTSVGKRRTKTLSLQCLKGHCHSITVS